MVWDLRKEVEGSVSMLWAQAAQAFVPGCTGVSKRVILERHNSLGNVPAEARLGCKWASRGLLDLQILSWDTGEPPPVHSTLSFLQALLVPELPVLRHSGTVVGWMQAVAAGAALTPFSGGTSQMKTLFCLLPSRNPVDYLSA